MKDLYVSWDEYHRQIERLAAQVHSSGWAFDAVVAIARGGLRVGDVFSRMFDRPLGVIFTSSYRAGQGTVQDSLMIGESLCSAQPLPGPRWLVVDDLVDSGGTLDGLVPVLRARHPQLEELRCAVLWRKAAARFKPDYCAVELPDNPWIHQPFEIYEGMAPELGAPNAPHSAVRQPE